MSKIASLGLAEKVSEGGKYSIEIYDADEESRIYSILSPKSLRLLGRSWNEGYSPGAR